MSTPTVSETHRYAPYYTPARAGEEPETTAAMAGPLDAEMTYAEANDHAELRAEMTRAGIL